MAFLLSFKTWTKYFDLYNETLRLILMPFT